MSLGLGMSVYSEYSLSLYFINKLSSIIVIEWNKIYLTKCANLIMEKNSGYSENTGFFKIMYLNMELKIDGFFSLTEIWEVFYISWRCSLCVSVCGLTFSLRGCLVMIPHSLISLKNK